MAKKTKAMTKLEIKIIRNRMKIKNFSQWDFSNARNNPNLKRENNLLSKIQKNRNHLKPLLIYLMFLIIMKISDCMFESPFTTYFFSL
jgi:hypothetical protein